LSGWIGVDLDGTLAEYGGWQGINHIGAPIPKMVTRVRRWLDQGREVRIFTARVCHVDEREAVVATIHAWLERHGLPQLQVTNVKDFGMVELWDDRCVQVEQNTGEIMSRTVKEP